MSKILIKEGYVFYNNEKAHFITECRVKQVESDHIIIKLLNNQICKSLNFISTILGLNVDTRNFKLVGDTKEIKLGDYEVECDSLIVENKTFYGTLNKINKKNIDEEDINRLANLLSSNKKKIQFFNAPLTQTSNIINLMYDLNLIILNHNITFSKEEKNTSLSKAIKSLSNVIQFLIEDF